VSLIQVDQKQSVAASELRRAFSHCLTPEAANLLLSELDAGLEWETAAQAVAEGIAERFRSVNPQVRSLSTPARTGALWRGLLLALAAYMLTQPALSIARESLVAACAWALRTLVAGGIWQPAISALRLDPVYAGAAIRSLEGRPTSRFQAQDAVGGSSINRFA
jgi:hypothetical protein